MKAYVTAATALLMLAGCEPMSKIGIDWPEKKKDRPESVALDVPPMDQTTPEPDKAAPQPLEGVGLLGPTVASLGDTGKPGFWIETPLVTEAGKGRVRYAKSGRTVKVDLIPIPGPITAGSRLSLATMRLLDAPLTGLPQVDVYRD